MQKNSENEQSYDNGFHPHEVHLKDNYKFYKKNIFIKFLRFISIMGTKFILFFPEKFVWGFKIKGKRNLKKQKKYVMVSNHTHPFDSFMIISSLYPKRIHYVTVLKSNMGFPIVSTFFKINGAVPIPDDLKLLKKFNRETENFLNKNGKIIVFPEASLVPFCDHIRPFMQGAFNFALSTDAPIIPVCFTYHKPKGLYKLTRKNKPCIHLNILEPYKIINLNSRKETTSKAALDLFNIISTYFNENSDYFKK